MIKWMQYSEAIEFVRQLNELAATWRGSASRAHDRREENAIEDCADALEDLIAEHTSKPA